MGEVSRCQSGQIKNGLIATSAILALSALVGRVAKQNVFYYWKVATPAALVAGSVTAWASKQPAEPQQDAPQKEIAAPPPVQQDTPTPNEPTEEPSKVKNLVERLEQEGTIPLQFGKPPAKDKQAAPPKKEAVVPPAEEKKQELRPLPVPQPAVSPPQPRVSGSPLPVPPPLSPRMTEEQQRRCDAVYVIQMHNAGELQSWITQVEAAIDTVGSVDFELMMKPIPTDRLDPSSPIRLPTQKHVTRIELTLYERYEAAKSVEFDSWPTIRFETRQRAPIQVEIPEEYQDTPIDELEAQAQEVSKLAAMKTALGSKLIKLAGIGAPEGQADPVNAPTDVKPHLDKIARMLAAKPQEKEVVQPAATGKKKGKKAKKSKKK